MKEVYSSELHGKERPQTTEGSCEIDPTIEEFQFNGNLYEQIDGVAMGSPLGPLMANAFMCSLEEKLARENKLPSFYKRYVDDMLALVCDCSDASDLVTTISGPHPSIQLTMDAATNNRLPFIGWRSSK